MLNSTGSGKGGGLYCKADWLVLNGTQLDQNAFDQQFALKWWVQYRTIENLNVGWDEFSTLS
jgi:hypothetical protein